MRERRYDVDSHERLSSPRRLPLPMSRDFSPSRHRKLPQYRRHETEEYSREANTARRIEERDHLDRDSNLRASRFSEYDYRDRDSFADVGRGRGSPRRIEKRDNFDRPVSYPSYEDGAGGKYEHGVSFDRSKRSYDDLSSTKFQYDPLSDGPEKFDYLSRKDCSLTRDSRGIGDTDITRGGEKDYYSQNRYRILDRARLLSAPQYLDGANPAPIEYESGGRMYSRSYTLTDEGVDEKSIRVSGGDGGSHMPSVASRSLNIDTDKQRYFDVRSGFHLERRDGLHDREDNYVEKKNDGFHFQERFMGTGKAVERDTYKFKEEDNLLSSQGYLMGDSNHMVSSSRSKDYDTVTLGILKEGFPGYFPHMSSDLIGRGCGLPSLPVDFDGYSDKKQNVYPGEPGGQSDGTRSSSGLFSRLPEERQVDRPYGESGRIVIDSMRRLNEVEGDYRDQHMPRTDLLNRSVDEHFNKSHMGDDVLWGQDPSFQVPSRNDKFDACGPLHLRDQGMDMLGTGSSRPNYVTEGYSRYGGVKPEEHHVDVDGGQWSHFERSDLSHLRGYDQSFDKLYDIPRKRSPMVDFSERRLRKERFSDKILYEPDAGIRISTDGNGSRRIYNQVDEEDVDVLNLSKKPKLSRSDYEKTWSVSREMCNDQPSSSKFHPHHSVGSHKSGSRDIKKRLGPVRQKLHVSQRLVDKRKPSVKQRLTPARPKKHATLPWLKQRSSNILMNKQNDSDGDAQDHDGDHLGDHPHIGKSEPSEKSEDFKQLVQSAFFKFLKQINETPIKRKKYTEQGKTSTLKCIVCGSNSDEFVGTESLAKHAFTSKQAGLRSQHLGLHKALCVLMGWKIAEEPSSEWHCEVMSYAETSAMKEDIIIWPPVVIVHNSTMDNRNPDEKVIVSTEKLDMKLKYMNFGSILKVCNGRPANQSVMVVKFSGTLSGLQEAERLHQRYVKSKHGRAELEQFKSESNSCRKGTEVTSAEGEDNFLYGHLGFAEDFDKLDFGTKRRCVLRSKRQILSISG
ncbi:hypothetical protein ACS0TY_020206 [Phlomoides rotata]